MYDHNVFIQTIFMGQKIIQQYLDKLESDDVNYLASISSLWNHFYSAITPKCELIFRNLTEIRVNTYMYVRFGMALNSATICKERLLKIGNIKDNSNISNVSKGNIRQMLRMIIISMREESMPLTTVGLNIYSIYEALFGPEKFLIQ